MQVKKQRGRRFSTSNVCQITQRVGICPINRNDIALFSSQQINQCAIKLVSTFSNYIDFSRIIWNGIFLKTILQLPCLQNPLNTISVMLAAVNMKRCLFFALFGGQHYKLNPYFLFYFLLTSWNFLFPLFRHDSHLAFQYTTCLGSQEKSRLIMNEGGNMDC